MELTSDIQQRNVLTKNLGSRSNTGNVVHKVEKPDEQRLCTLFDKSGG